MFFVSSVESLNFIHATKQTRLLLPWVLAAMRYVLLTTLQGTGLTLS
jgi:hypothetical protein